MTQTIEALAGIACAFLSGVVLTFAFLWGAVLTIALLIALCGN